MDEVEILKRAEKLTTSMVIHIINTFGTIAT